MGSKSSACPKCGSAALREIGKNRFMCRECGTFFYACPECGATFFSVQELGGHMRAHRRQRPADSPEEVLHILLEIRETLKRVEERLEWLESAVAQLSARAAAPAVGAPTDVAVGLELPEFLRGNPWIDALGRRRGDE